MSFNEAVKDVLNKFEEATRDYVDEDDCKGKYYRVKREFQDDENLRNMIYECHDEEIPNGWSYRTIINILEHLTSWDITTWDDAHDIGYEIADSETDDSTYNQLGWYRDNTNRLFNINEAIENGWIDPNETDIFIKLQIGQYYRINVMINIIANYIEELVNEEEDEDSGEEDDKEEDGEYTWKRYLENSQKNNGERTED